MNIFKKIFNILYYTFVSVVIVLLMLRIFIGFNFYIVSGSSMEPTMSDGDYGFFIKSREYKKGDIVSFEMYQSNLVKTLVAVEGDTVEFENGNMYVNDKLIHEEISEPREPKVLVGEGEYYFIGDNFNNSNDSREFGIVREEEIVGKILFNMTKRENYAK